MRILNELVNLAVDGIRSLSDLGAILLLVLIVWLVIKLIRDPLPAAVFDKVTGKLYKRVVGEAQGDTDRLKKQARAALQATAEELAFVRTVHAEAARQLGRAETALERLGGQLAKLRELGASSVVIQAVEESIRVYQEQRNTAEEKIPNLQQRIQVLAAEVQARRAEASTVDVTGREAVRSERQAARQRRYQRREVPELGSLTDEVQFVRDRARAGAMSGDFGSFSRGLDGYIDELERDQADTDT